MDVVLFSAHFHTFFQWYEPVFHLRLGVNLAKLPSLLKQTGLRENRSEAEIVKDAMRDIRQTDAISCF